MNKYEMKRMHQISKLSEQLRKVAQASFDIKIDDEKTMDKAKTKAISLVEQMLEVLSIRAELLG